MRDYQREFIEFALAQGVLRFGSFTLKSGRQSPYFFNAGLFNTGRRLAALGRFYAAAIEDSGIAADVLFGPAYKGIPIASATAVQLAEHHDRDLPWCFNRKEAKDHGEGGLIVGSPLAGRVLLNGLSLLRWPILRQNGAQFCWFHFEGHCAKRALRHFSRCKWRVPQTRCG